MEIIRNLTRRKLRNTLTISGIVIGVLALVTMGAMAFTICARLAICTQSQFLVKMFR